MLFSLVQWNVRLKERMKRDFWKVRFPFIQPLHTYRLQRSNHSGRVRMRVVVYVEAPDEHERSFRWNFIEHKHSNKTCLILLYIHSLELMYMRSLLWCHWARSWLANSNQWMFHPCVNKYLSIEILLMSVTSSCNFPVIKHTLVSKW